MKNVFVARVHEVQDGTHAKRQYGTTRRSTPKRRCLKRLLINKFPNTDIKPGEPRVSPHFVANPSQNDPLDPACPPFTTQFPPVPPTDTFLATDNNQLLPLAPP